MRIILKIYYLLIALIIIGVFTYGDFYIWRLKHPNAPFWTYFFLKLKKSNRTLKGNINQTNKCSGVVRYALAL